MGVRITRRRLGIAVTGLVGVSLLLTACGGSVQWHYNNMTGLTSTFITGLLCCLTAPAPAQPRTGALALQPSM